MAESSGDTSCRDFVAFGSSVASSTATVPRRSVRLRRADVESESGGSDPSRIPTAFSSPNMAPEIPLAAKSRRVQQILTVEDPAWIPVGQELVNIAYRSDIRGFIANPVYEETFDFYALSRAKSALA